MGTVPVKQQAANKPWISKQTLDLISSRQEARAINDVLTERKVHKQIRASAKADRARWLNNALATGDWTQIRLLRKPKRRKCGRLRNEHNELVDSDRTADTMADHLEFKQWHLRSVVLDNDTPLGPALSLNEGFFSCEEVRVAALRLRRNKAVGPDHIPAECWRAIANCPEGLCWLTDMFNRM